MLKRILYGASVVGTAAALLVLPSGCVGYVLSSGYYQAELLASRVPLEKVMASGELSVGQEQRLRLVPEIKAYGATLGLASTDNYDTIALGWDRTIYNLSACDPLAFEPVTWWFPIVGRVPYLGFFRPEDAQSRAEELRGEGHDVYVRTAGAYSTLGWFRDPILPGMLAWGEADLAETIFHELAHATLWIPGSVSFNESFANFTGEAASFTYLAWKYGADAPIVDETRTISDDYYRWQEVLFELYKDLDKVYTDPALDETARLQQKQALFATLPSRIEASSIVNKARYIRAAQQPDWNNARLMQYRTYNTDRQKFQIVLDRNNGDIYKFIQDIGNITKGAKDPFAALASVADVQNP